MNLVETVNAHTQVDHIRFMRFKAMVQVGGLQFAELQAGASGAAKAVQHAPDRAMFYRLRNPET
ncbi:MAG: hypothetical protein ACOYYS_09425 [Chloroflexota bacterium]